jgi:hypothetical protein
MGFERMRRSYNYADVINVTTFPGIVVRLVVKDETYFLWTWQPCDLRYGEIPPLGTSVED